MKISLNTMTHVSRIRLIQCGEMGYLISSVEDMTHYLIAQLNSSGISTACSPGAFRVTVCRYGISG
jgi:hypothetical protein